MSREPWDYLEKKPAKDAPDCDNPSGLYCSGCRSTGLSHCGSPEWCGHMRMMKPVTAKPGAEGVKQCES